MILSDVLYFAVSATGTPRGRWDVDFMDFPYIVQLAWIWRGRAQNYTICPEGWEIPQRYTERTGITQVMAEKVGDGFGMVLGRFLRDCKAAKLLCGHNIYFDTSTVKANFIRAFGREAYDRYGIDDVLYKGKRLDTMKGAKTWVDARYANGRQKFPSLQELYAKCYPGERFEITDALSEAEAVKRCLPILLGNGILALREREYREKTKDPAESA